MVTLVVPSATLSVEVDGDTIVGASLTPVTVIENASRADQRVLSTTLNDLPRDLADAEMTGPALTFYGLAPRAAVQVATETPLEELA